MAQVVREKKGRFFISFSPGSNDQGVYSTMHKYEYGNPPSTVERAGPFRTRREAQKDCDQMKKFAERLTFLPDGSVVISSSYRFQGPDF